MKRDFGESRAPRPDQYVVLIVDDEPVICNMLRICLEAADFFVLTANDGEGALVLSRKFSGTIHILITDIIMPKLDGLGLREQILRERPATKVLLMSALTDKPVKGIPFLRKPFPLDALKKRVWEMLASSSPAQIA